MVEKRSYGPHGLQPKSDGLQASSKSFGSEGNMFLPFLVTILLCGASFDRVFSLVTVGGLFWSTNLLGLFLLSI